MKTIFAIILAVASINAMANNSYCDNRPTRNDAINCYEQAVSMNNANIQAAYRKLKPLMTDKEFADLRADGRDWGTEVNNRCTGDLLCLYDSTRDRVNWMNRQVHDYSIRVAKH